MVSFLYEKFVYNLETLSLEKDFAYGRRGKLKGHGYSDEHIDEILSDKLTFIRHLMPEAQSVLLCDKADFKSIMDFLFYSITVCTERTLSELLIKSFFDLCKNYAFSWRLDLKHIMTVLDNYGINPNIVQEGRCNDVLEEYRIACGKGKFRIKLQTFYQDLKRKQVEFTPVPGDKFTFCLYNFILFVSEISVGTPSRLDFRTKNDWSDLCVLIFIFSLLGTEQRFVTNYRVFESISNMFLYHFDSIPAKYWYCGSDRESLTEKKRHKFTSLNFPKFLALMIHEFYPGERGSDVMCWKPETMGRLEQKTELQQRLKDLHQMEHGLNIIHKLEMLPASYRGNQVKRFLAFLYMSTCLDCAIPQRVVFPSIVDVADSSLLSSTYLRILMHKNYSRFSEILVIVKLCDMIVGNDLITDFSKDKVPSIIKVRKDLLEKLTKKLPSTSSAHKSGNITILFQLRNHLQIVMQRWNFGCESS